MSLHSQDQPALSHKLTWGAYYSRGDYGADQDTEIQYYPLTYEVARFPWLFSVTIPYLRLAGPGDVFLETGSVGRTGGFIDDLIDEDGIGDAVVSATYQLDPILNDAVFVDFTLQAKIPSAAEERNLGTGETDLGYQLDFYGTKERDTYFASAGYRKRGRTPLYDLRDSAYFTVGYMRQMGEADYLGMIYDYREKTSNNSFESHEFMPFYSWNPEPSWSVMLYTIIGLTDGSADRTLGFQVSYTFP